MATRDTRTARDAHVAWAKERALAYLPDVKQAMASFVSDLRKNEDTADTADNPVMALMALHAMGGLMDADRCRDLIEGTH